MAEREKWLAQTTVWSGQAWGIYRFNLWLDAGAGLASGQDVAERHALEHFTVVQPSSTRLTRTDDDADWGANDG